MQRKDFSRILKRKIIPITVVCTIFGCSGQQEQEQVQQQQVQEQGQAQDQEQAQAQSQVQEQSQEYRPQTGNEPFLTAGTLESKLLEAGLINIHSIDSLILVDLKYSTVDNFVGVDVYGELASCYLQPAVAKMLRTAQKELSSRMPGFRLLLYDCARPLSVQQILWDTLNKPEEVKHLYVADPQEGSIHNFGSAADLTIANDQGVPLDMGTGYDHFGELAYPTKEQELLEAGKLTRDQLDNRQLLREVMEVAGFSPIDTEWWHFNAYSRERAAELFEIIE